MTERGRDAVFIFTKIREDEETNFHIPSQPVYMKSPTFISASLVLIPYWNTDWRHLDIFRSER